MKVACIIHSLDGGGAERVMATLASQLVVRQHHVTLITLDDASRERHPVDSRVVRRSLDVMGQSSGLAAKFLNNRRRVLALRRAITDAAPDVVLSFCDRTNILVLFAAHPLGVPVVVSERSDPSQQKLGAAWEFLRRRAYRHATAIIALTETSALYLRKQFRAPIRVIPSAVDVPPFQSDRSLASSRCRIVGVGRLEREKGFDRLIESFAAATASSPAWTLRILGEGSMRRILEQQIRDLGLTGRVTMPGWIQPVWDELAAATIFALPSRYEGFPSALLEAMALGVPSIAVDCESGPRAVMGDTDCGLLVTNDEVSLAEGIHDLMVDASRRERLGQAGRSVVDRFGWQAMVDAYDQVLSDAASAKKPRRP